MSCPTPLSLCPMIEGDHFQGFDSITVTPAPDSDLASATLRFKKGTDVVELASPDDITLVDANAWELEVPPQAVVGLTPGTWNWQLATTAVDGNIRTIVTGSLVVSARV